MSDLASLAYPRHLHKRDLTADLGRSSVIVRSADEAAVKLSEGYMLACPAPVYPGETVPEPVMATVTEDTPPLTEPVKRGRRAK